DSIRLQLGKDKPDPPRLEFQRLGDELRQQKHPAILVEIALSELRKSNNGVLPEDIVIDGIRNVGEVNFLREEMGYRFTLIAVLASLDARWDRIESTYTDKGMGRADFIEDDMRDKNEE